MSAHKTLNTARATRETPFFGDVCLLGLGVTGRAVFEFFLGHPNYLNSLTIYPGAAGQESNTFLQNLPDSFVVKSGETTVGGHFDIAVASPGIPPHSPLYQSALEAAGEVISEPELAWRISPEKWIAVTGTNGKTTVTELITSLLEAAGKTAWAAGNIGTPCIEVVASREPEDWLVAELSSYQLHSTVHFAPDAAVLLNITPDHMSWHGSFESYCADKQRIFANLASSAPAIIDVTQQATRAIADELTRQGKRVVYVGTAESLQTNKPQQAQELAYVDPATDALILERENGVYRLLRSDELRIKGQHNLSNALASAAAVAEVGATREELNAGLASFFPLPHRFEPCGEVEGISFINDSKATNIDAALKALATFTDDGQEASVIALFGGLDKGTDLDDLAQACEGSCRDAVCYGEAGGRFHAVLSARVPSIQVKTFEEAFKAAFELAEAGDTILLSPACASFDEFDSFEARGEQFKQYISQFKSRQS
ncbi:MAG: UDP-N-acetylmuramoyl-L-alanine--D-glutamate ligase [Coriobacteriales bacterium]|jgi:UDP-N-acetylmuramoylalanine--D-glutamate ligase|nr:UDP-N-acetylmuramoyl-L-alanine--D-glutamate ligase [Coriobacteriales bacterium]